MVEIYGCSLLYRLRKLYFTAKLSQYCFGSERHGGNKRILVNPMNRNNRIKRAHLGYKISHRQWYSTSEEYSTFLISLGLSLPQRRMLGGLGAARIPNVSGWDSCCTGRSHCSAEHTQSASKHIMSSVLHEARDPPTHVSRPVCILHLITVHPFWYHIIRTGLYGTTLGQDLYSTWTKTTFRIVSTG